jgi:hypothetical protein
LIGGVSGQQLSPTHSSSMMARCAWILRAMAVPLAAMMPNARIEATIAFMVGSSDTINIVQALVPSCDRGHKNELYATSMPAPF